VRHVTRRPAFMQVTRVVLPGMLREYLD